MQGIGARETRPRSSDGRAGRGELRPVGRPQRGKCGRAVGVEHGWV